MKTSNGALESSTSWAVQLYFSGAWVSSLMHLALSYIHAPYEEADVGLAYGAHS